MTSVCHVRFWRRWVFATFVWGVCLVIVFQLSSLSDTTWISSPKPTNLPRDFMTAEPLIDHKQAEDKQIIQQVHKNLPSLPLLYWKKAQNLQMYFKNESCARYPSVYDIQFSNTYWQTLRTSNGTFELYNAYFDDRKLNMLGPCVRILGMINRVQPTVKTYCQLWFDGKKEPVLIKTYEYKLVWYKKWGNNVQGIFQPYIITCQIPVKLKKQVPVSVSLVEKPCNYATNNLAVVNNRPKDGTKKGFATCVKGLDFLYDDLSVKLVEWIELITLLGSNKIFFYTLQVHPNITKVLDHYEKEGRISVTPLSLAGGQPNYPGFQHMYLSKKTTHKRQNELIPYNDCFYKNMYTYKYVTLLDIDEVIMPKNVKNWDELMKIVVPKALAVKNQTRASYTFRNTYFLDDLTNTHFKDIPKYMHMLQHVYRTSNYTKPGHYIKCFHDTDRVLTLHNHYPFACLSRSCTSYAVPMSDAHLQHYRTECVSGLKKTCEALRQKTIMDSSIWRYKEAMIDRTTQTLLKLGFFET